MAAKYWIQAARLRTLPLAVSAASCGCLLADLQSKGNARISLLTVVTAVLLQIFSNFANDYGDAQNGADSPLRQGPARMVSTGLIEAGAMKKALYFSALLCCISGLMLLEAALPAVDAGLEHWLLWMALGAAAIVAAYRYTAGRHPYGYAGLGDAAVFVFFGWLAVLGGEYLHTGQIDVLSLLPASAMGAWCCMVLNLNNMRDIDSDKAAGKRTLAVRLGSARAKVYHTFLAVSAAAAWLLWLKAMGRGKVFLLFFIIVLTFIHLVLLKKSQSFRELDRLLPQWSITVLAWMLVLWLSL